MSQASYTDTDTLYKDLSSNNISAKDLLSQTSFSSNKSLFQTSFNNNLLSQINSSPIESSSW
ncbi:7905_t:CDS:1, partial [Cetraspora pellucida]